MHAVVTKFLSGGPASRSAFRRIYSCRTYAMANSAAANKPYPANNSESDQRAEFKSIFPHLVQIIAHEEDPKLQPVVKHYQRVLEYNAPHGKHIRGLLTVEMYRELKKDHLTEKDVYLSQVVGWCNELLQGFFLVSDDIMDGSTTRRGQPCWYLQPDIGLSGFNDSLLLESALYKLLKRECGDRPYYFNLLQLFHEASLKTTYGQCLDMLCCNTNSPSYINNYTPQNHAAIVEYKTSYYSFVLPIAAAMYMAGIDDPKLHQQAKEVLLKVGNFFQVQVNTASFGRTTKDICIMVSTNFLKNISLTFQDDFIDCFGDPTQTGKIGTDIQEGKCSWLVVNALQKCDAQQRELIKNNYGRNDDECVKIIKKIYLDLDIPALYNKFETEEYEKAMSMIKSPTFQLPSLVFENILNKLRHRQF